MFIQFYTFCDDQVLVKNLPTRVIDNKYDDLTLDSIEAKHIKKVFKINNGNFSVSSKILGITRDTLKRKLEKYNIVI